jgi:hypothetical protein
VKSGTPSFSNCVLSSNTAGTFGHDNTWLCACSYIAPHQPGTGVVPIFRTVLCTSRNVCALATPQVWWILF